MQNHSLFNLRAEYSRAQRQQPRGERHLAHSLFAMTPAKFILCKPYLGGIILTVTPQDMHKAAAIP